MMDSFFGSHGAAFGERDANGGEEDRRDFLLSFSGMVLRFEDDLGDRVKFPYRGNVGPQSAGTGSRSLSVAHVEEQGGRNCDGDRRIVEIIGGAREICAEECLIGITRVLQLREMLAVLRR